IVEPQITKNSTKTYSINLTENKISGGYITTNTNNPASAPSNGASADKQNSKNNTNQLAGMSQLTGQNPLNLVFIIIAIVFGMGVLGLLLVKFRKRTLEN
ncbi:MAG: hypothetical protein NT058_00120, partial [Candidatus Portnoybacteria bacterium]|nr:hypothetical protein [Candidatus Portnoybacteria bacterium]